MHTRSFKPFTQKHGVSGLTSAGIMTGVITLIVALIAAGAHAGDLPATAAAAESSMSLADNEPRTVQWQRVELIRELRAENLADFDAMERAPGLFTQGANAVAFQRDRVATIDLLRSRNVADFEAMEQHPGLYT